MRSALAAVAGNAEPRAMSMSAMGLLLWANDNAFPLRQGVSDRHWSGRPGRMTGPVAPSRLKPDALPQRGRVIDAAAADRPPHAADVADGVDRVGVEHDQVGTFAALDGAELSVQLHGPCRHDGRGLERLHRRHPRLDVQLDLAVNAVA